MKSLLQVKLWITMMLSVLGCVIIIAGLIIDPKGEIHNSVLIAFGQILTFVGLVFNMKYSYQSSLLKYDPLIRWAKKKGIDIEKLHDDIDIIDDVDKKQSPASHDDGESQT